MYLAESSVLTCLQFRSLQRLQLHAFSDIQSSSALWFEQALVTGEGQKVGLRNLDVDGKCAGGLRGIDQ